MVKILMLTPRYNISERGTETFTRFVKEKLVKKGYNIRVLSNWSEPFKLWKKFITKTPIEGFFKKYIGIEPDFQHFEFFLKNMYKDFSDYDLIWNNGEMWGSLLAYKIRKRQNIPFITTFHGNESALMITEGKVRPNTYIVLTPRYKVFLGNKKNIKCIPNGVNLEKFNPNVKPLKKYGLDELEHPIYLSTSALTSKKRIHLVIEALSKCKGSLVFSSKGPEKEKLLELAEQKLKGRFKYVGVIPMEELPSLYTACDIYVSASRSEGHSLALLEALASGLPVVTHDDENRRWSIGEAGFVVDVTDLNKFSHTLKEASKHLKTWLEFDEPRKQAEEFSWDNTADEYSKIIDSVLHG